MINEIIKEFSKPESFANEPYLFAGLGTFSGHLLIGLLFGFLLNRFKYFGFYLSLLIYSSIEYFQGWNSADTIEDIIIVLLGSGLFFFDRKTIYIFITFGILFFVYSFLLRFENMPH